MGLAFDHGWAFPAGLIALAAVLWIDRRYRVRVPSLKRRATLLARLALIAALTLAMAAPSLLTASGKTTRWVVLDVSDSAKASRAGMEAAVSEALTALPKGEEAGVIAFGDGAMVEVTPAAAPVFTGAHTAVGGGDSDLDAALLAVNALLPADGAGSLLVVSDGNVRVSPMASMLAARGIRADAFSFAGDAGADAQLSELNAPASVYEGQSVTVEAVIDANAAMSGSLALYQNGQLIATREVEVAKGENRFAFREEAMSAGVVTYEARLLMPGDAQSENNSAAAYVRVSGAPKVLLVSDTDGIGGLFEAAGIRPQTVRPAELFASAEDYLAYDAVILNNVDYDAATQTQWRALDDAVRKLGRGLCVLGGDKSYALGGYRGTLLEELLPVNIDVRNKLQLPSLSLIVAIDKSGSMTAGQFGTSRIEVAKQAAVSALEVLTERDNIGVIGFDGAAKWVVPFQRVTDAEAVKTQIATLRADGGTAFYTPLTLALETLLGAQTAQKHIIFLSDGQPGDSGFESVVSSMRSAGITLTTVAVGSDADARLMLRLATLGGGRSYEADEFSNVPKIFAKETMMASGSYVQNRVFTPVITENAALTDFEGFPALTGYLSNTEKGTAIVSLVSDTDDPLLARWNVGAGKALCWTSDAQGAWTEGFLAWEQAPAFFGGMVSAVLPGAEQAGVLACAVKDDQLTVSYAVDDAGNDVDENLTTEATVLFPDGTERTIALAQVEDGRYEATLPAPVQGAYAVRAAQTSGQKLLRTQQSGAVKSYAREYDLRDAAKTGLADLVAKTGGRTLADLSGVWDEPAAGARARRGLTGAFTLAALALLLIDIALRKLPWEDALRSALGKRGRAKEARAIREKQSPDEQRPKKPARPSRAEAEKAKRQAAAQTASALLDAKRARGGQ